MLNRPLFKLFSLPLLLLVCLTGFVAPSGAAVRPPTDGQIRSAGGRWMPPGSVLTDVSSQADLAQATRKVVVEFRPEDRGGAQAISRSTYDPANPLPISGLVIRATRAAGGVLTYDLTAVSDSQPRFYIRGQKSGGQQTYLQVVGLNLQPLAPDSAEVEAWLAGLQFSDNSYRVPADTTAQASVVAIGAAVVAFIAAWKGYKLCSHIPWIGKKCKGWLEKRIVKWIAGWLGAKAGDLIAAILNCSKPVIRATWRKLWHRNPPKIVYTVASVISPCG